MQLTIITPEKELYNATVKSVRVPGSSGHFQVLQGHAPIVSSLQKGVIRVVDSAGEKSEFQIERGFIEVLGDAISVLATQNSGSGESEQL